jgi:hypothetical protein
MMIPLIFFLITHFYSVSDPGEIYWSPERKLTYSDFKAPIPSITYWAATTTSNVGFSYSTTNDKISGIKVYCAFNSQKSWMKTRTKEVLAHEQLHFDITEFFDGKNQFAELFKSTTTACEEMQTKYDDATNHGVDAEVQQEWKIKVESMLSSVEQYPK